MPFVAAINAVAPQIDVRVWPDDGDKTQVSMVLCWQHPPGVLLDYPNLRCICSLGAGVDHLFADKNLPTDVPVVRLVDDSLAMQMFEYVLAAIVSHVRQFDVFNQQQRVKNWQQHQAKAFNTVKVGVMGLGELGGYVATGLAKMGFVVAGWSRKEKSIAGVDCYFGEPQKEHFLSNSDIVVNLLPLTPQTSDILNHQLFTQLPQGAYLINVGRGGHLVDDDLIAAIDSGQLSGACLDVFRQEPLPPAHPFWSHPNINVTPHCSSLTSPMDVAGQIVENYQVSAGASVGVRVGAGNASEKLNNVVDVNRGY